MTLMALDLKEADQLDALTMVTKFAPDFMEQMGYHVGYRSGLAEGESIAPKRYDADVKTIKIAAPLFDGYRGAMSYRLDVKVKRDFAYPADHNDLLSAIAHRFVAVLSPEADGSFMVLFIQSGCQYPEGLDEVQDRVYDYAKAREDNVVKPFFHVTNDIVRFLVEGVV